MRKRESLQFVEEVCHYPWILCSFLLSVSPSVASSYVNRYVPVHVVFQENRVLLTSTTLVALLVIIVAVTGLSEGSAVLVLLVVAGVGVLGPQLYLAATDEDIAPRTRIRVGVLVTLVFAWGLYSTADPAERPIVAAIGAVLFLALVGYEFVAGYRSAAT